MQSDKQALKRALCSLDSVLKRIKIEYNSHDTDARKLAAKRLQLLVPLYKAMAIVLQHYNAGMDESRYQYIRKYKALEHRINNYFLYEYSEPFGVSIETSVNIGEIVLLKPDINLVTERWPLVTINDLLNNVK